MRPPPFIRETYEATMQEKIEEQITQLKKAADLLAARCAELTNLREKLKDKKDEELIIVSGVEVEVQIPIDLLLTSKANEVTRQLNRLSDVVGELYGNLDTLLKPPKGPVAFGLPTTRAATEDPDLEDSVRQAVIDSLAERSVDAQQ